jgi:hypothetical protein
MVILFISLFVTLCVKIDPSTHKGIHSVLTLKLGVTHLLFNCLQPIVGIHYLDGVRECHRLGSLEFSKFATLLRLWSLLHVGHSLLHSLQHLSLHDQHLL